VSDDNTDKDASSEKLTSNFLEGLYGDPLRPETMRTGRQLIIASAVCAAVVLFNVRLQSTSLIPLDFGNRIDVLPMLLAQNPRSRCAHRLRGSRDRLVESVGVRIRRGLSLCFHALAVAVRPPRARSASPAADGGQAADALATSPSGLNVAQKICGCAI
jgi:hypothetical protein